MAQYKLSKPAAKDLGDIFDYTVGEHGLTQAKRYVNAFHYLFLQLAERPTIGRHRTDIKNGLFSFPHKQHTVYFRVLKTHIRIVRVLHHSRDVKRFF